MISIIELLSILKRQKLNSDKAITELRTSIFKPFLVLRVAFDHAHVGYHFHSLRHSPKNRVFPIKPLSRSQRYEELNSANVEILVL